MKSKPLTSLPIKAKLFRGFADPSRLAILDLLRNGPKCVYDIAAATGLSQPNTSAHLACLEDCGLVQKARRGKFIYYRAGQKEVIALLNEADRILDRVGQHIFRCTRYGRSARGRRK